MSNVNEIVIKKSWLVGLIFSMVILISASMLYGYRLSASKSGASNGVIQEQVQEPEIRVPAETAVPNEKSVMDILLEPRDPNQTEYRFNSAENGDPVANGWVVRNHYQFGEVAFPGLLIEPRGDKRVSGQQFKPYMGENPPIIIGGLPNGWTESGNLVWVRIPLGEQDDTGEFKYYPGLQVYRSIVPFAWVLVNNEDCKDILKADSRRPIYGSRG